MAAPLAALMRFAGFFGKGGKGTAALDALGQMKKDINLVSKAIDALKGNWDELDDITFKTSRTMALSREQAEAFNQQLMTSTRELAAQFGITAKEIAEFQKNYAEAVGRNIILTREQISHMAALSKITDSATAQKLVDEFDKVGAGIARATAYTGRLQERAKALGVSPSKATKMMADNIRLAASYSFRNGVNDIEKMALRASSLRMDMNAVMSATEKFANIEDAITNSANIQLLGGSFAQNFSNPMGAMYEAMADPKGFMDRLERTIEGKGRYDEKTGTVTFDPVTMMQMREMAKTLGMSVDQLTNPAMAKVQNARVEQELKENGAGERFKGKELELLQNLSRTNIDEKTGKHFVTLFQNGREVQVEISNLTKEQLQLAKDSQLTEEQMFDDVQQIKEILERVHGRARETGSYKEQKEGWSEWWATARADVADVIYKPWAKLLNTFTNTFVGKKYFSTGGIATPLHAAEGTVVPGDSYTGDKVPAMLNSGEMVLNPMQQKSMFSMISSLAVSGGMFYGMNKIGGKMGLGGLGSTMLLANALGGDDSDLGDIVEAHYIKKSLNGLKPLGKSIKSIGKTAKETSELTAGAESSLGKFGKSIDKFSERIYSPFDKIGKKLRSTRFAKGVSDYYDTLKNTTYDEARKRSKYYKNGKPVAEAKIKGGKFTRGLIKGKYYFSDAFKAEEAEKVKAKPKKTKATGAKTLDIKTGKEVTSEKVTTAKTAKRATKAAKSAAKASKALGTISKVAKVGGRVLGPLGTLLTVGSSVYEGFQAKSKYDKEMADIRKMNLSGKEKDALRDKAEKERNKSIGGSVGSAVGAAAGAALGTVLGPIGMAAGGWLGSMAGEWVGKGIGGLFGGNRSKKYENPAHAKDGLIVPGNSYTGDKVPVMANSGEMILDQDKQKKLFSALSSNPITSTVRALPDLSSFLKVLPPVALASAATKAIGIGKTNINLNVSGTIKLEGGGKSVDFDISKIIETPEFKRQLTDMITRSINENSNSGKRNMESERNNMARQYNRTGS